jgi:hypothetical protein
MQMFNLCISLNIKNLKLEEYRQKFSNQTALQSEALSQNKEEEVNGVKLNKMEQHHNLQIKKLI